MSTVETALIFDLDGTLADTMPAHFAAWTQTCETHGLVFPEGRFYAMGGVPSSKIAELLVKESGRALDPELVAHDKEQAFVERLGREGSVAPIAPIVAIARQNLGVAKMAIASGGRRELVLRTLEILGIRDWFPVVVASEDTERHKPEPDVFLEAARQLGVAPAACTVYEDTDIGIEAARRAGMRWVDVRPLYVHLAAT
jgi:HAD superfamily hydrolase (TIGR01509 family)